MHRAEWKAFHHSIRQDARAFRESHGGFPCFTRRFVHNGEEWSFTRARNDGMPLDQPPAESRSVDRRLEAR